jgi:hypothetical protein
MAVCAFCRSTLVRRDMDLENLGVMAELAEDRSPFALRFRGKYRKVGFELIGRLQLRYDAGYWNEWFARFDDGRMGWVSEGSGLCYLTFVQPIESTLPPLDSLQPGQVLKLGRHEYTVSDIEHASCVAVEGELPFRAMPGYDAPSVDLQSETGFASIDYSDTPPRLYTGEAMQLDALLDSAGGSSNKPKDKRVQARDFKCTNCGAPITVRSNDILAVGCGHCGAVIDAHDPALSILSRALAQLKQPLLMLGTKGKIAGDEYTLIGFLCRKMHSDDTSYFWDEYLLHSEEVGYAWLSEYDGHWTFGRPVAHPPKVAESERPKVHYQGRDYRHFEGYQAEVVQVMGEFTWRVRIGETVRADDFISPPYSLSRERSDREITWTDGEYIEPDVIAKAFKPENPMPQAMGVGMSQPRKPLKQYWAAFSMFFLLVIFLQFIFVARAGRQTVWSGSVSIPTELTEQTMDSQPIHIGGRATRLVVLQEANLDNEWVDTDIVLVNTRSGENYLLQRELSYYHGSDSDGSWTEGGTSDRADMGHLPDGDYVVTVNAETEGKQDRPAVDTRVVLETEVPVWGNFWLLLFVLLIPPMIAIFTAASFESRRWSNSDYGGS